MNADGEKPAARRNARKPLGTSSPITPTNNQKKNAEERISSAFIGVHRRSSAFIGGSNSPPQERQSYIVPFKIASRMLFGTGAYRSGSITELARPVDMERRSVV
jgi:hypothetical protein